jgi:ABC-2 type transport system permease protein
MNSRPGSLCWLLGHEMRLSWREFLSSLTHRKRKRNRRLLVILGFLLALFQLGAFLLVSTLSGLPPEANYFGPSITAWGGLILVVLWSLMVMHALNDVVRTLFGRGDLPLLLCSPIPAYRVLAVRAIAIAASCSAVPLLFTTPLVNALVLFGHARWAAIYPLVIGFGCLAAAAALALARGLIAMLGPERTQSVAQILAAIIGASIAVVGQLAQLLPDPQAAIAISDSPAIDLGQVVRWPVLALLGEPWPTLAFLLVSFGTLALTVTLLGPWFSSSGELRDQRTVKRASSSHMKVYVAPTALAALRNKEFLLLRRDPWLFSQIMFPILYLIPLYFVLWRSYQQISFFIVTPVLVIISAQLAGALAWITVSGEDSPDVVGSAPVFRETVTRAKVQVIVCVLLMVLSGPLVALSLRSAWMASWALLGCGAAAAAAILFQLWYPTPGQRRNFRARQSPSKLIALAELGLSLIWGIATAIAAIGSLWAVLPLSIGLLLLWILYTRAVSDGSQPSTAVAAPKTRSADPGGRGDATRPRTRQSVKFASGAVVITLAIFGAISLTRSFQLTENGGHWEQALLSLNPRGPEAARLLAVGAFRRAKAAHMKGDHDSAQKLWTEGIAWLPSDPERAQAYYQQGLALQQAGLDELALASFSKAAELDPSEPAYPPRQRSP